MSSVEGKTLLIVGAGFGQVPAIEKAIELGLNVIVIDKNPNAIGMAMVDKSFPVDIIDEKAVLKLAKAHKVDGVMTMQTDLPIPTIGLVNDKLNLTGVSYQCAIDCSHKTQTRLKLKEKGVAQPVFEIVTNHDAAKVAAEKIGFPVIVKAVDSSGSRGVTKVENSQKVAQAFDEALKYSRQKNVLVEEFIDGVEIGAQAFSINGECVKVLLHNDTLAPGEFMVPTGHSFPTFIEGEQLIYAEKTIKECVEALEINNGPSNIDLIFDKKDGKAKIIEVGARIGATCLPELVKYYTGIDWVEATILNALGEDVVLNETQQIPTAAEILEAKEDGILKEIIIPDAVKNHKDVLEIEVTESIGEQVSILRKGTDRIGKIIVKGASYQEAEALALNLKSKILFKIEKH
ncbi:ATP-grasp domain-containing protein [Algibacter sp. L3A6]|uniref:ATP-grasp domain-containing protein n=1 Tax=Algibacter sp. L3A6 TaxID=2686366 RepID=UPI00131D52C4|nr:ATP-grasp domain-containing protein [Algibacter sp. L3A6]